MTFYKYRHKYNHGYGDWRYIENHGEDTKDNRDELAQELMDSPEDGTGGDGYRGLDIEICEPPPVEWLKEEITNAQNSIKYLVDRILRYERLIGTPQYKDWVIPPSKEHDL